MSDVEPELPTSSRDAGAAEQSRLEADFGSSIPEYVELGQLLHSALRRLHEVLEVDTATLLRLDPRSNRLIAIASYGIEEEVHQGVRIPVGFGFAGNIAAQRAPVIVDHVDHRTVINPLLWERGLRSMLGVPMVINGRLIGVLHVGSLTSRVFTSEDVRTVEWVSDRLARAVYFSSVGEELTLVRALQRSLLPSALPETRGLELAARYVAGADTGLGGDWYDLFPLPGDHVGLVMGDVAGHGLEASIVMGRIRSALRAYALEWPTDPAAVLAKVDAKIQHFEPGVMVTVAYGVLDPSREVLTISNAGHPPPVIANAAGAAFIDAAPDLPIGLFPSINRQNTKIPVTPGDSIALYTDGLVERRGESLDVGLERLLAAMTNDSPEAACARVMSRLIGPVAPLDDVALLIARRTPEVGGSGS